MLLLAVHLPIMLLIDIMFTIRTLRVRLALVLTVFVLRLVDCFFFSSSRPAPRGPTSRTTRATRTTRRTSKKHGVLGLKSQPLGAIDTIGTAGSMIELSSLGHGGDENAHAIMIQRRTKLTHGIVNGIENVVCIADAILVFDGLGIDLLILLLLLC